MRRSRFVALTRRLSLVVLVLLTASPTLGLTPKYGGDLTLRLRDALLEQPGPLRSAQDHAQCGLDHRRTGGEVVVARQRSQPGVLPEDGSEMARRQAFQRQGRQIHVRLAS